MLSGLVIKRERSDGFYKVKFMASAFNATTREAFIYAEFDRVREPVLTRAIENYGAKQIQLVSYTLSDYITGAANGLKFVKEQAVKDGFTLIERGASTLRSKISALVQNPCHLSSVEFDVVKKRRQMAESTAGEDDPEALRQFEEFEASVLDALTNTSQDYQKQRYNEFLEAETDVFNGAPLQKGMFYVAVSRSVMRGSVHIPKLGATRRSDPMIRLKELARNVPYAFELVFCIPTFTPFRLEAEIHQHFAAHRIRERACTEFFDIDLKAIGEYLKAKFPGEVIEGSVSV